MAHIFLGDANITVAEHPGNKFPVRLILSDEGGNPHFLTFRTPDSMKDVAQMLNHVLQLDLG